MTSQPNTRKRSTASGILDTVPHHSRGDEIRHDLHRNHDTFVMLPRNHHRTYKPGHAPLGCDRRLRHSMERRSTTTHQDILRHRYSYRNALTRPSSPGRTIYTLPSQLSWAVTPLVRPQREYMTLSASPCTRSALNPAPFWRTDTALLPANHRDRTS